MTTANVNSVMADKLKDAGVQVEKKQRRKITPQDAAKRFMVDIMRPAIISYDVRTALTPDTEGAEEYKLVFNDDSKFTVVSAQGSKEMTLVDLIPIINKHNLCIASAVFPSAGVQADIYSVNNAENNTTFTPVEGCPWGFDEGCIAWYRENNNGQDIISAIVLVPGYRLYGIKDRDDIKGVLLEDTDRNQVFVPYGEFSDVLMHETKESFLRNPNKKIDPAKYKFSDHDFVLLVTKSVNFSTSENLQKISGKDFEKLRNRYAETHTLDAQTCFDEDNITIAEPWIAYFRRHFKMTDTDLYLAYIGAPGYEMDEIVPGNKADNVKPHIFIKDTNGNRVHIHWLNYHDCLNFANFKEWEESPNRIRKKKKKSSRKNGYPGVGNSMEKPMMASAAQDAAKADSEEFSMSSLEGVTPLK